MNHNPDAWPFLLSESRLDIALLQEALRPRDKVFWSIPTLDDPWCIKGYLKEFSTAIVGLSDSVEARPLKIKRLGDEGEETLQVSLPGTIYAAEIMLTNRENLIVVSVYSKWENPYNKKRPIYADASAHRLISDLSALASGKQDHPLIVAGDWNILYGYGEEGNLYWKARYDSVFARMDALGLPFLGPQYPQGNQADPWPAELPRYSLNVPTFKTKKSNPATATRQLDFVFASKELHDRLSVRALNAPEEWGPSDHCRVLIDLW